VLSGGESRAAHQKLARRFKRTSGEDKYPTDPSVATRMFLNNVALLLCLFLSDEKIAENHASDEPPPPQPKNDHQPPFDFSCKKSGLACHLGEDLLRISQHLLDNALSLVIIAARCQHGPVARNVHAEDFRGFVRSRDFFGSE
jgi:hypothetical protein